MDHSASFWAREEFGHAVLGDARRVKRLVRVARSVADNPAGRVTKVFSVPAEREAAFRLLEKDRLDVGAVARAAHEACARRASAHPYVYVPVDGTSLAITDGARSKGLGTVGAFHMGVTGLQVMSAIATSPDGTPLGMCGQTYWARTSKVNGGRKEKRRRPLRERETRHWGQTAADVQALFARIAPGTKPWLQFDRDADAWEVLLECRRCEYLVTVRAAQNRRLWTRPARAKSRYLWSDVGQDSAALCIPLDVPATPKRAARRAVLELRYRPVCVDLHTPQSVGRQPATFWAVHARERGDLPAGVERIDWMLLTTFPVVDTPAALQVIHGYVQRWKIEEFHRTWKTGACNVETTQLRSCEAIVRWATILASVAMRIQRLTKLARTQPDLPATSELTRAEVDAVIQSHPKARLAHRPGDTPKLGVLITWLAELGGYTGKSSGGPPGATVITRGFDKIQLLAAHLERDQKK